MSERSKKTTSPRSAEEELGIDHECCCRGWEHCALCRSTRLGSETLSKARLRQIHWPTEEENSSLVNNPISNPVPPTTLEDAFDSLVHTLNTASRICHNYHCCHDNLSEHDSLGQRHRLRYHRTEINPQIGGLTSSVSPSPSSSLQAPRMFINALPGNYRVTAARCCCWEPQTTPTSRVVNLDPEKSITITMTV